MSTRRENYCWPGVMISSAARTWLVGLLGQRAQFDVPMERYTSFQIGGTADVLVEPQDVEQLKAVIQWTNQNNLDYLAIGGGTNLLVLDGGIRGVVLLFGKHWADVQWRKHDALIKLDAGAGVPTRRICRLALKHGWYGVNFALGIPGSLGGAILMNAGTRSGCMHDILERVTLMTAGADIVTLERDMLKCNYRSLGLPDDVSGGTGRAPILLSAHLALTVGDIAAVRREATILMRQRVKGQPSWKPSAGCVFKNPPEGKPAGWLIEYAGLKGKQVGGACVSDRHANFIINQGGATAQDVLRLMQTIQEAVMDAHGIWLDPEVRIVGEEKNNAKESA